MIIILSGVVNPEQCIAIGTPKKYGGLATYLKNTNGTPRNGTPKNNKE